MLGAVSVKVTAGRPEIPLRLVGVFAGSAMTVEVINAPRTGNGVTVSGVTISVENASGVTTSVAAEKRGGVWTGTIPASHFAQTGTVSNGLTISATGTDEAGVTRTWTIGKGDLEILDASGVPTPGETIYVAHVGDDTYLRTYEDSNGVQHYTRLNMVKDAVLGWTLHTSGDYILVSGVFTEYSE